MKKSYDLNLSIDIGNTHIHVGIFHNHLFVKSKKFCIGQQSFSCFIDQCNPASIIIASVNNSGLEFVKKNLDDKKYKYKVLSFKDIQSFQIPLPYPDKIGIDRLLNMVSARKLYAQKNICVIDSGTATTIDILTKNNFFLGGAILPGAKMLSQVLYEKIPGLPHATWENMPDLIGNDTEKALQSGAFWGYISMINGMISYYKKELSDNDMIILGTGGVMPIIAKHIHGCKINHDNLILTAIASFV